MRKSFPMGGVIAICLFSLASCGAPMYLSSYAPEESSLNVMKITDETSTSVAGCGTTSYWSSKPLGFCSEASIAWGTGRFLDISPDGKELAYLTWSNNQWNIMVRKTSAQSAATQRTFRNVSDFSWGSDDKLYFGDQPTASVSQISTTDAHIGTLMRQITNNNYDFNPILSANGKLLYFTRSDNSGSYIWSYELETGSLTACCPGCNPYPIGDGTESFLCVRNTNKASELWLVNYKLGQETLILSDTKRGFTNPVVSPDGEWILCQGNSLSSISKKQNLDIFVVKMDGTNFTQLTYHPATDCCPVWSKDGKYIYFISNRANKDSKFNIWRMNFDL